MLSLELQRPARTANPWTSAPRAASRTGVSCIAPERETVRLAAVLGRAVEQAQAAAVAAIVEGAVDRGILQIDQGRRDERRRLHRGLQLRLRRGAHAPFADVALHVGKTLGVQRRGSAGRSA